MSSFAIVGGTLAFLSYLTLPISQLVSTITLSSSNHLKDCLKFRLHIAQLGVNKDNIACKHLYGQSAKVIIIPTEDYRCMIMTTYFAAIFLASSITLAGAGAAVGFVIGAKAGFVACC